ncbi:hypothetical protein EIN_451120 [Entamoeba invadens IP1]|uniref:Uncharacterized protein n=1 Tax=Entamoeba invadens IP1 TaxID=370355 RepID=A0A0A1UFD0_ENTIV|nr:hypothetical protein EIN_451120 [Entamoeba invadens IP1]ELP91521.1 hypothetical protein EIN_451120 [Entamoeba invadens IP1]|eukprot:XP_004258292.1 hypothetical protein EIN_451120 [Entamoeba invadens IP1]
MFPFGVTVSIVLDIFANILSKIQNPEEFQDIALEMVQTAWSTHIFGKLVKRIDCGEIAIIGGITIASIGISVFFPPAAPYVLVGAGVMLEGGLEVYQQLKMEMTSIGLQYLLNLVLVL